MYLDTPDQRIQAWVDAQPQPTADDNIAALRAAWAGYDMPAHVAGAIVRNLLGRAEQRASAGHPSAALALALDAQTVAAGHADLLSDCAALVASYEREKALNYPSDFGN